MDDNQSAKMISWLDEERRNDKSIIAQLERENAAQQALIEDLVRRTQALEGHLAALQENTIGESRMRQSIEGVRAEVMGIVERNEENRLRTQREDKKLRDDQREGSNRAIEQIRQELLARFERDLGPRLAFEDHINTLAAEVEEAAKSLFREAEDGQRVTAFLEEQRRLDSRRVSELQEEMADNQKRVDSLLSKLDLVEELARRNERLGQDIEVLRQTQSDWMEDQEAVSHQREKLLSEMQDRLSGFETQMESYAQQIESWGDTHSRMKKYLEDADRLADRIDRRVNEVSEMARLSEERFRQEWEGFVKDDHKRWRQFTLTASEAWREHDRQAEQDAKRLNDLESMLAETEKVLHNMLALEKEYAGLMNAHFQEVANRLTDNNSR